MIVNKLGEYGYDFAVLGFSLSYNSTIERTKQILPKYAFGVPGEGKFLESIIIWVDVTAPRYWWQEADTYRLSTKQSESTMHTIMKREFGQSMFEEYVFEETIDHLNKVRKLYLAERDPITKRLLKRQIKNNLPEGFLQRRIWCISYKTLQNIYNQRLSHELTEWPDVFIKSLIEQIEHPEFIVKES